jgi:site-specific DNA-methyltransferase (adenine-specific)
LILPVSKPAKRGKKRPLYRSPPPPPPADGLPDDLEAAAVPTSAFILREDGSIEATDDAPPVEQLKAAPPSPPKLAYRDDARGVWLYHGNCLELLDAIAVKYPEGRFDCIFADPPYFLSNGGITCHAGRMVKVDKGDWDKSRGPELNHEFNLEWLRRCQRVLKPNGTIWVSGTLHVIFSIGYAMQQLGFKILNDITWEKPNPPPNLSCRYFTHSTETVIWAAENEKSKHCFNYDLMRQANGGKQMKSVWTMTAPGDDEKTHGKHPTQKPVTLVERCLLASTKEGDLVLDPFLGGGTTAVVAIRLGRGFIGTELEPEHASLAARRTDREVVAVWLKTFRVAQRIYIVGQNDLDPILPNLDRINGMAEGEPQGDYIYHETKFVFLSCAKVAEASIVHTTVDVSLQEAWTHLPNGKKRETTHVVRCETAILRLKPG